MAGRARGIRFVPVGVGASPPLVDRRPYERLFTVVRASLPKRDQKVLDLPSVDSTSVLAPQHAAAARFTGPHVLRGCPYVVVKRQRPWWVCRDVCL